MLKKIKTNIISRRLRITCFVVILVQITQLISSQVHAQGYRKVFVPYSTVGGGIGTASYYGDMAPYSRVISSTFKMIRFNVTGEYTRHFSRRLAGRLSLTVAQLAGDDYTMNSSGDKANYSFFVRNIHFRNNVKELAASGIFKLVPDGRSSTNRNAFGAYVFGGVALFAHNPKARLPVDETTMKKQKWVALQPLHTEGQGNDGYAKPYSRIKFAFPVGVGLSYRINSQLDIAAELGMRFTNSDYLDDVSGNYPNSLQAQTMSNRTLERYEARKAKSDRTAILRNYLNLTENVDPFEYLRTNPETIGSIRGDSPTHNDSYLLGTIKLVYILKNQVKCPPLK